MDDKKESGQLELIESIRTPSDSSNVKRFDEQETKRLLRKIDWVLLPFISLLYL